MAGDCGNPAWYELHFDRPAYSENAPAVSKVSASSGKRLCIACRKRADLLCSLYADGTDCLQNAADKQSVFADRRVCGLRGDAGGRDQYPVLSPNAGIWLYFKNGKGRFALGIANKETL